MVEIFRLEQGRRPLAGAGRQDRRIHQAAAPVVEEAADRPDDFGSDLEHGVLLARAEPEMAVLHQERRGVLLGGDRIILGDLNNFDSGNPDLDAAGSPLVLADAPADDHRRFLR